MTAEHAYIGVSAVITAVAAKADAAGFLSPTAGAVLLFTIVIGFAGIMATRLLSQSQADSKLLREMRQSWYGDPNNKDDDGALGRIDRACATIAAEPGARVTLANRLHEAVNDLGEKLDGRMDGLEGKVDTALKQLREQAPRRKGNP